MVLRKGKDIRLYYVRIEILKYPDGPVPWFPDAEVSFRTVAEISPFNAIGEAASLSRGFEVEGMWGEAYDSPKAYRNGEPPLGTLLFPFWSYLD